MYQFNETLMVPSKSLDDQISSPKLTVSPTLSSSRVKRGFKSNSSAAFLRKRIYSGKDASEDTDNCSTQTSLSSLDDKSSKTSSPGESLELKDAGVAHFIDTSDSTTTADEEAFEDQANLLQKFYRVMVIGPRAVGKRSFVNGLFSSNGGSVKSQKQPFDLIVKTVTDGIHNKRYNFWLQESEGLRKNYHSIYNVYYETCSVIFLVYNSEEENSMNFIERELDSLKEINAKKNKNIVVLDTNINPKDSDCLQLEELKSRYGFRMSLELSRGDKSILDIIDNISDNCDL